MKQWLLSLFNHRPMERASVTLVRRYGTANGYIGELYVNGRHIGVTCDNLALSGVQGVIRHLWTIKPSVGNSHVTFRYGEFDRRVPLNVCYVGSTDRSQTKTVIVDFIKAIKGKEASLVVIERLWSDLTENV